MPAGLLVTVPDPVTVMDSVNDTGPLLPLFTVTTNPCDVALRTETLIPFAESTKDSPGSHMPPASSGLPLASGSTTCASRSPRVVSTRWMITACPGSGAS